MPSKYRLEYRSLILATGGATVSTLWGWAFERVGEVPWWTYAVVSGASIFLVSYGLLSEWPIRLMSRKRLEEEASYRREFLSNVSHELRTSVFVLQGFLDALLLTAQPLSKEQQRLVDRSRSSLEQLTQLIEDIRSTSLIESGEIHMQRLRVDIKTLCEEVIEEFESSAKQAKVSIRLRASEDPAWVYVDRKYMRQVMRNLIQNAIHYNRPKGFVEVEIQEEHSSLRVSVKDTGIGIPVEDQPRIFERFYRVEKSRTQGKGGTGIGLALVKHILEAHGAQIEVKSEPKEGTDFWFFLQTTPPTQ